MRAFHFTTAAYGLAALQNQRLKVARISELNDPFELLCSDLRDKTVRAGLREFKRRQNEIWGLLCFSKNWSNPLLWSHYADKHKGVALELDIAEDAIMKVRYVSKRVPFDVAAIMASGGFSKDEAESIFITKSIHWKYEREVRVAVILADSVADGRLHFEKCDPRLRLVGVVAGPLCPIKPSQIAASLPAGCEVKFQRARIAHKSFDIVPNKQYPTETLRGAS